MKIFRRLLVISLLAVASALGASAQSDAPLPEVPIVSGGLGFLGTNQAGVTSFQPIVAPVVAIPIGDHVLIEGRGTFQGFIARENGRTGPYQANFFDTVDYFQLDYTINSHVTIVIGRFLTPFNIYGERLSPIWIHNLQDAPITYAIGTRTSGSNDGAMLRGTIIARDAYEVNYTAYYSISNRANDPQSHFASPNAAGGRAGVFLPGAGLEFGGSYQRYMQNLHQNVYGIYLSWQPPVAPLDIKGEYAHSVSGSGYWVEGSYRLSQFGGGDSAIGRLAPVARVQQFFRNRVVPGDALPAANTQQVDFGLNYYLPHEIRLNGSYGRQFTPRGNANVWNFGITYRFLFPMWPGGSH